MGLSLPHMPWDHKPPPAPPPPEVVAAFSDLLTGMWILATIVVAAAIQQLYMHWRRGGERRAMISRCLQRSYRLPALASLRREAITACAEMWLAFERRLASGGGGGSPASPERPAGRPRSASSLESVPEHAPDDDEARSAEEAETITQILASRPPARTRTSEDPAVAVAPYFAPDSTGVPFAPGESNEAPPASPPGRRSDRPAKPTPTVVLAEDADADRRLDDGGSALSDGGSALSDGEESPARSSQLSPSGRVAALPVTRELRWCDEMPTFDKDGPAARLTRSTSSPACGAAAADLPPPPASPVCSRRACPDTSSRLAPPLSKSAPGSGKAGRRQIVVLGDARAARSGVVERIGRIARKHGVELVVHEGIPRGCDAIDVLHSQVDAALVVWDAALAEGRDHVQRQLWSLRPLRSARSFSLERLSEALLPGMPPPEAAADALHECRLADAAGQCDDGGDDGGDAGARMRSQPMQYRGGDRHTSGLDAAEHCVQRRVPDTTDRRQKSPAAAEGAAGQRGKPAWWPF